ncbi:hypothetical protein [Blastomonas sp. AAP53]|uniref:hypothetical protein n=1 Tax=Blastomonas sp. AAP53 TaxID=1248760 RepID=UPI00031494BA|nr:hypothetical protein [Blastomonas sp. AAP53]
MRSALGMMIGAFLVLLAGCSAEPDFDEKFDQRSRELSEKARQIETEANAQLSAAREADKAAAEQEQTVTDNVK